MRCYALDAGAQILVARRYDTFWSTGDEALARAALAPEHHQGCITENWHIEDNLTLMQQLGLVAR